MISFTLLSSGDVTQELAGRLRERRLAEQLTQEGLAQRSGVSLGTLKKFESTGQISLMSFVKLVATFGDERVLEKLLRTEEFKSMDQLLEKPKRQRGKLT